MANILDKFTDTFNSTNPNVARVANNRASGGTTLQADNLAGWPAVSKVHFSTYKLDSTNSVIAGSQRDWSGIVTGTNIGSLTLLAGGADPGNVINDVIEMNPTGSWGHDLFTGLSVSHNLDGTIKSGAISAPAMLGSGVVATANLQDALINSAKIADGAVTPSKLSTGATTATDSTASTSAFQTYAAPIGAPSVTVTVGTNGIALVNVLANVQNNQANSHVYVSYAVSGATTQAATDTKSVIYQVYAANANGQISGSFLATGLTAGSNTFTLQTRTDGNVASYALKTITVIPL